MNAAKTCWGIYRELAHSPGRIDDDSAILRSVGDALARQGFRVELVSADAADVALELLTPTYSRCASVAPCLPP